MRNFRNLNIWKVGMDFTVEMYQMVKPFPTHEKFGLTSQITRAAVSIPSNIAEGCRGTDKELVRFLNIALGFGF